VAIVTELADGIITNSEATLREIARQRPRTALMRAAALGVEARELSDAPSGEADYFLCLSTIEPRKNHLLLLHLWRAMAETRRVGAIPKLLVVGRRGWENEMVLDMLDRCEAIRPFVEERNRVADDELTGLVRGALAVLMPSFAEGFGFPIGEALALGAPVICSDLPAHRELGGDAPEYLDPIDAVAWRAMIEAYAEPGSAARAAQLKRIRGWRAPTWVDHFAVAGGLIEGAAQSPGLASTPASSNGPGKPMRTNSTSDMTVRP
jgi:glycosyltransferase involved in cell wall biosynthesis